MTANDDNHIVELCAELARYGVMIKVDSLLEHHPTKILLKEIERVLWDFLHMLLSSDALTANANRDTKT